MTVTVITIPESRPKFPLSGAPSLPPVKPTPPDQADCARDMAGSAASQRVQQHLPTLLVALVVVLGLGPLLNVEHPSVGELESRSAGAALRVLRLRPSASSSTKAANGEEVAASTSEAEKIAQPQVQQQQCAGGATGWRSLIPPTIDVPYHDELVNQRRRAIIKRAKQVVQGPPIGNSGGPYPGEISVHITSPRARYSLAGEGLLRAEPRVAGGVGLLVRNKFQPANTYDSFYVRLVGPSVFTVDVKLVHVGTEADTADTPLPPEQCPHGPESCDVQGKYAEATYKGEYHVMEPGIYTISVFLEYRHLPANLSSVANPLGDDPDPLKANQNTFAKTDQLLYTGLVDARYPDDSFGGAGRLKRAEGLAQLTADDLKLAKPTFGGEGLDPQDCASAGELPGRWVLPLTRFSSVCPANTWRPLLRDSWEWRPYACRIPELCADEAAACVKRMGSMTVAGDSVAREVFDDVGSSLLGRDATWREIFEHKHASGTRIHEGAAIRMLWLPDPLKAIPEQLEGGVMNAEQYTKARAVVVSAGYWYVYRTSLEDYLAGVDRLIDAANRHLKPNGTELVWLTIPAGWMNFGYRVRPRIEAWNAAASMRVKEAGWRVIDLYGMSNARPEKTDGTHIGDDTDRSQIQGIPVLSRHVTNALLVSLCGAEDRTVQEDRGAAAAQVEWPNWPNSHRRAASSSVLFANGAATGAALNLSATAKHPATHGSVRASAPPSHLSAREARLAERRYHIGRLGAHYKGGDDAKRG